MGLRDLFRSSNPSGAQARAVDGTPVDVDIVGESQYQAHIKAVQKKAGGGPFTITLVADVKNAYDSNAVVVMADGGPVGYLSRDTAKLWQQTVLAANAEGYTVTGTAEVFGGEKGKPSRGVFGTVPWPGKNPPPSRWLTGRPAGPAGNDW
jgi:hypothetical protein